MTVEDIYLGRQFDVATSAVPLTIGVEVEVLPADSNRVAVRFATDSQPLQEPLNRVLIYTKVGGAPVPLAALTPESLSAELTVATLGSAVFAQFFAILAAVEDGALGVVNVRQVQEVP